MKDYIVNAVKFLTIKLGNVYGACGLAGNIMQESGMISNRMEIKWKAKTGWDDGWHNGKYNKALDTINPAINNGTYRNYFVDENGFRNLFIFKNDNCRDAFANDNMGYGLVQWTTSGRKYTLYDFCKKWCDKKSIPFEIGNLQMQLDFILQELQNSKQIVYGVLLTCKDILTASNFVCVKYEIPQGYNTERVQLSRYKSGQGIFDIVFEGRDTLWFQYTNNWYYMENGLVKYDKWVQYKNDWYYLNENGKMETNKWKTYDGKWYYLSSDGSMAMDTYVDWNGTKYYLNKDGAMEE